MSSERVILRSARPPLRRLLPALAFGTLSAGSAVALLATSAWLITRAAEQPALLYISVAVVGVRRIRPRPRVPPVPRTARRA